MTSKAKLLNSKIGIVQLDEEYVAANDLYKFIRTTSRGVGKPTIIDVSPFEKAAAKVFTEKYPDYKVHYAQKVIYNKTDNSVDVILFLQTPLVQEYTKLS